MVNVKYVELVSTNGTRFKYTDCYLHISDPTLYIVKGDKNIVFLLNNLLSFNYILADEEVKK